MNRRLSLWLGLWVIATACNARKNLVDDADASYSPPDDARMSDSVEAEACPSSVTLPSSGTALAGQSCVQGAACATGPGQLAVCDVRNAADEAAKVEVCHVLSRGRLGDACSSSLTTVRLFTPTIDDIAKGAVFATVGVFCDEQDLLACGQTTHTCQMLARLGESCADVYCVNGAFCSNGACAAPLSLGSPCPEDPDLLPFFQPSCDDKGFCDANSCVPTRGIGEICAGPSWCVSHACKGGECVASGTCP